MTLADARPVLAAFGDGVPAALRDWAGADADTDWSAWLKQRDADIRVRIATGDEDSVVNLMLYGTRFTRWPRATPGAVAASAARVPLVQVMDGRAADLAAAIESPGGDERLQFVRHVVERHGIDVGAASREATRRYLVELRSRVLSENERYTRRLAAVPAADVSQQRAAHATLYRDRGLSSDTSHARRLCPRAGARRRTRSRRAPASVLSGVSPLSARGSTSSTRRRATTSTPCR